MTQFVIKCGHRYLTQHEVLGDHLDKKFRKGYEPLSPQDEEMGLSPSETYARSDAVGRALQDRAVCGLPASRLRLSVRVLADDERDGEQQQQQQQGEVNEQGSSE